MRSKTILLLTVFLIISGVFMGIRVAMSANPAVIAKPAMVGENETGPETPVFAAKVTKGKVRTLVKTSAEILPRLGVNLNPEAAGKIINLYVDVGSVVKKDQKLAQIDNKIQKAQYQEIDSVVTVAKSAIKLQEVVIETQESRLVAAKAAVDAANSALKNISITRKRLEKLFTAGALSRQAVDDVIAQFDAATARQTAAVSDEKLAEDAIKTAQMTLEMRKAELVRAEANRNSVRVLLDNTSLVAPFDGVITARHLDPGAMASLGMPMLRIEQDDPVKILCSLPERDLSCIDLVNTKIAIKVDSFPDTFDGEIRQIYPSVDAVSRTGKIEILVPNKDKRLKTGMFANVSFIIEEHVDVPIVSRDSVMRFDGKTYVYLIENGKAVRKQIETGIVEDANIEVVSGLNVGDTIIAKGIEFIREGVRVSISMGDKVQ